MIINARFNFFTKFQFESVATIIFQPVENSHPLWWHAPRHARPSLLYCRQRPNSPTPRLFARPSQCCLTLLWSPATAFYPCRRSRAHTLTLSLSLSLYCILPLFVSPSTALFLFFSLTVFYLSLLFLFCLSFSHSFLFPRSHHLYIYPSIHLSHPRPPSTYLQTLGDPTHLSFPFILRVSLTLNFPIYLFTPPSRTLRVAR